jgi:hypothetical protein
VVRVWKCPYSHLVRRNKNSRLLDFCWPLSVRVGRIGLPSSDWQPDVLPLNHTRLAHYPSILDYLSVLPYSADVATKGYFARACTTSLKLCSACTSKLRFLTKRSSAPTRNRTQNSTSEASRDIRFTIGACLAGKAGVSA